MTAPHGKVDIGDGLAFMQHGESIAIPLRFNVHSPVGGIFGRPEGRDISAANQSASNITIHSNDDRTLNRIEKTLKAFDDGVKSAVIVEMINIHIREHGSCKRKP